VWYELSLAFNTEKPVSQITVDEQMEITKALIAGFAIAGVPITFVDSFKVIPCP
jgi:hypothetical protein